MPRCSVNIPGLPPQLQALASLQQPVRSKARAVLASGPKVQALFVPVFHSLRLARRNPGLQRRVTRCQGRIAPAVVAVQVGVEQQIQLATLELLVHQVQQQGSMGVVPAVHQHAVFGILQEHAVGRKPAALEHVDALG